MVFFEGKTYIYHGKNTADVVISCIVINENYVDSDEVVPLTVHNSYGKAKEQKKFKKPNLETTNILFLSHRTHEENISIFFYLINMTLILRYSEQLMILIVTIE